MTPSPASTGVNDRKTHQFNSSQVQGFFSSVGRNRHGHCVADHCHAQRTGEACGLMTRTIPEQRPQRRARHPIGHSLQRSDTL